MPASIPYTLRTRMGVELSVPVPSVPSLPHHRSQDTGIPTHLAEPGTLCTRFSDRWFSGRAYRRVPMELSPSKTAVCVRNRNL